jgi:aerobic-type carbon monoxide dehydrogenase small subunit (CoxS/CutS family)
MDADSQRTLLSVLRDDLDLTGTKYGCGEGQCGACTVLLDGEPVRSFRVLIGEVGSREVLTIEGVANEAGLHPLQQAFLDAEALQCGFCTSGMIMSGVALLERNAHPTEDEIIRGMNGNICRCGTYRRIVSAIQQAAGPAPGATP